MTIYTYKIFVALTIVTALAACNKHTPAWNQMDMAEGLMNTQPDSALTVLDGIPTSDVKGKETSARYALLKSMALDKNYIDTTTFDVLQPAIDYYITDGTPDEQLRTYYYQGRIYQNKGDEENAMLSFINAQEINDATDTLTLAHLLVAQGTLYLRQYKVHDFVANNIESAKLYGAIGKHIPEIKSYTKAIDGYVMMDNKEAADSILSICIPLVQKNPDGEAYLFSSLLAYTMIFGTDSEIKNFLDEYRDSELTTDDTMNFAQGYAKIGEYDRALELISSISPNAYTIDSLKYASVKIDILEKQGNYEQALKLYKDYSAMLERYQNNLLSQDLLFVDKKHQLEMGKRMEIHRKDRIIGGTLCVIFALVLLVSWLYYRGYISRTKRMQAEKENENLKLERDNLNLIISRLKDERDNLKELQKDQSELSKPIQDVIKIRLDMLNGLLASEITGSESHAKPYHKWIESIRKDKVTFMNSTREAFAVTNPKFIDYLQSHDLTDEEINYLCLYAIGLRGKEVGEYIELKRHYNVSSEIRHKLGIDEHETNLALYIRRLLSEL